MSSKDVHFSTSNAIRFITCLMVMLKFNFFSEISSYANFFLADALSSKSIKSWFLRVGVNTTYKDHINSLMTSLVVMHKVSTDVSHPVGGACP